MLYPESDLLPISALQHLIYCERQCALIHLEQAWAENSLTVHGKHLHEKADSGKHTTANGVRIVRSLPLRSLRWGLIGKADVVEFRASTTGFQPVTAFPVEYKRGKPKPHDADRVQLCAQALCLEEMLQCSIPAGALFYGKTRRRLDVPFDAGLRQLTEKTILRLHELIGSRITPRAVYERGKCERCSLIGLCMPGIGGAAGYLDRALAGAMAGGAASD
jgi:CRISPR-associated exonuclease Cas4